MKNLFLLNRLGFNPDLTTRQSRVDSVSNPCRCRVLAILLLILTIGVGNAWGATATYSVTSTSAVSASNAPTGSSSSYVNTYTTNQQTTSGNTATLTLTSLGGVSISNITLSMHSNTSNGSGKLSYSTDGGTSWTYLVGSAGSGQTFSNAAWNGSYTTSWVDISKNVSLSNVAQLKVRIEVTNKSLYCRSFSITYTAGGGGSTPTLTTSSSMTTLTYSNGSPVAQSFTIGGSNLTNTVRVTAPTDYQVSKSSGSGYANYIEFTNTEVNAADKTVYIRLQSGLSAGNIASRDITVASSGATSKTIAITGSVPYTITWMANGSTFETTYVAVGSTLALPASDPDPGTYSCAGKYFYGWYGDGSSYSSASVAPSIAAAGAAVSADKTYYAVFADRSGSGAVTWDKVTSAPSDWSGDYVIVRADGANAMISDFHSGTSGEFKSATVTINAAGTQITSTPTDKMIWIVAKNGNNAQYSFKNKSTNTYAQITGTSSTNAALNASAVWFTIESTGTSGVWDVASVSNSARCFAWYGTNSSFRTYAKSNYNTGRLFKKSGEGYTYSNYETSCCTPLGQINGPISLTTVNGGKDVKADWSATTGGNETGYHVALYNNANDALVAEYDVATTTKTFSNPGAGTYYVKVTPTYSGAGSYCAEGTVKQSGTIEVSGNVVVTFKRNGGGGAADNQTQEVTYNSATALSTIATIGYTAPTCKQFGGWATSEANATAGTIAYADGANITATSATTLWAVWTNLTYAVTDGTMVGVASHSYSANPITCGNTLTITCAADGDHKGNPTVTATGTHGTITVVSATSVTIANVTSAIAVSISYAEKVDVTATWNVNNGSVTGGGTTTQKEGSTFTFPNVTSVDCGTFLGWTDYAHRNYNETSGKPSPCYNAGSTIVLNANTQFYAVYSKVGDDAVAGTLYQYNNDGTDLDDDTHGVTPSKSVTNKNSAPWIGFESVGNYIIWDLGGTPTSFSAYLVSSTGGTGSGQSTMVLEQGDKDGGVYTWDATPIATRSTSSASTEISMNITDASKFEKSHLRLRMSEKRMNIRMGAVTINGLIATITYTTNPGCVDWVLDAISVTTAPTKTTYNECEEFDPAGMVVTGSYYENGNPSNTTTKDVAGYTWSPEQFLTPGNTIPVTITYTEKAVTKTTTYNVRVNDLTNYTITFHDGGNTTTWTQSNHCDACNLDSRTGSLACGDYTFAGWSSSSTSYDDQSATITTWVTGSYVPTANTDLYAVYRKGATPAEFSANCAGGTFTIGTKNGGGTIISRAANVGQFNSYEYGVANSGYTEEQLGKFLFEKVADNTYKISLMREDDYGGGVMRFYIAPDDYSAGSIEFLETYDATQCKWKVVAGTSGSWRIYSEFRNTYITKDYGIAGRGNDGATPRFRLVPTSNINGSDNYDVELTPVATNVYQSNPNCGSPYTITFDTHGGSFVKGNYAYSTATTSGLTDPTVSKFPSATMTGCTFAGWREGSAQDEVTSNAAEADLSDVPYGLYAADADLSVSSNKTYHAVYHYYDDDWTFDLSEGGTYHMYTLISGTKHYVSSTPTNSWASLTTSTDCAEVKEVTVTPGTGANAGKYTLAVDGYNIIPEDGNTNFKRGDFWWTITDRGDGTYAINGMNNNRNIVSNSTGSAFQHVAYNGVGSTYAGWYYPYFGRCRQHHWTSTPTITPSITLGQTGNIYITSTNGKTIKATNKLTLSATRYGTTTKIYLSANVAGVGFLKADGTTLPYDSHGTYISTESSGELATTNIVVTYSPTVTTDGIETVTITAQDNSSPSILATASRTVHVRHLPAKFLIATKVGDDWYALPNNMTAYGNPAAIKLSSVNEATGVATYYSDQYDGEAVGSKNYLTWALYAPVSSDNANYGYKQHGDRLRFADTYGSAHYLELKASDDDIKNSVASPNTSDHPLCELLPGTNDLIDYTLYNEGQSKYLGVDGSKLWGAYVGSTTVRFLIPNQQPAPTITWYNDMLDADHATNKAENGVVTLPTGADPVSCNSTLLPTFCGWKDGAIATYVTSEPTYVQAGDAATTDKTYYAVFKHATLDRWYTDCPTIYTITYTANGGTGADHLEYTMNTTADAITVGAAGFSKEGCTFVGWTNPDDVDGTIITPGAGKITGLTGDITLNAVWIGTTTVTGTVRLTASAGEKVATGATDVTISSTDFACATALRITYKDVTNDVTYGRSGSPTYTSSEFRLCNGSYGSADGTNISLAEVSGAYNQTFSITYEPNGGANTLDHYQLKIEVLLKNTVIETKTLELYGRTLPASFAIATKIGGAWYALPNNMGSEGTYDPILISVTEDANVLNWTAQGPSTAAYKMKDYTVNYSRLRFAANDANQYCLWAANGDAAGIRNWSASSTDAAYGWIVAETNADFSGYTMATSNNTRTGLMISNNKWGMANSGYSEIHFIPLTTVETIDIIAREWKTNGLVFAIAADNNVSLTSGHTKYGVNAAPTTNVTSITRHSTGGYGLYEVGLADITGDYGKVLSLKMKIGGDDKIANVTIPIIVSGTDVTTAASEPFTTLDAATKDYDVVILDGAKLTTNATASHASKFHNLYVYAGGTLINGNGSTSVNYLEMRGGIKGVAHKEDLAQGVPHLRLNKQISSTNGANLDMYVNTAHSYALSVPFEVSLSGVNYANSLNTSTGAAINGTLDSQFRIMRYDGETRSTGASGWTPITSTSYTLQVGQGYVLQGKRPKGQPFAVIRFPFTGVNNWADSNGEGKASGKPAINIYAHEGGANTPDNDKGWNLIANPYMATISYSGLEENDDTYQADFTVGCLEKTNTTPWDGKYSYTEKTDAYITMPNDWYSAFPQYRANSAQAVFEPFKNFFIQTSADGSVLFDRSKRASAPRHLLAQTENVSPIYADINLTHGDDFAQAGLKIDANATTGYKFGEDQNIFENREALTYLKVYTVADGHYLVGNTLTPAETAELIPLEFYAPNINGEYVFSLDANSDIDRLEYVILYDAELGLNTNLLTNDYTVELEQTGLIENRFSIGLKVKEKDNSATGIDDVGGDSERPYKFLYRDKMYILRGGKIYDATGKQVREIK